jgi:hypothetical protein
MRPLRALYQIGKQSDVAAHMSIGASQSLVPILVMQQQHSRASGQQMTARQTARKKPIVGPIILNRHGLLTPGPHWMHTGRGRPQQSMLGGG